MAEAQNVRVPQRILNTLLSSLTAGVVPRVGAPYIAIGRGEEIGSLIDNLDSVGEGSAFCRFLIGRYGSGKSFLIQLIRGYALDRGFISADADLSPERRLTGGNGAGLATYRELLNNLATKSSPDGKALAPLLSKHLVTLERELIDSGILPEDPIYKSELKKRVYASIRGIESDVGGFDFSRVLGEYYVASIEENEPKKNACLRWLRGEYSNKTEARRELGITISSVIDDDNWYNHIKLIASLSVKLGYKGLILFIDECVNLFKIPNRISREANYEKLLAIFNDTLQGKAGSLGVIFGGTPAFLEDTRRGLFSYEALRSRLVDSKYALAGYQNLSSPVIRLRTLSPNELLALCRRLSILYCQRYKLDAPILSDKETEAFMRLAMNKAGAGEMITPREIIRDYLTLMNILRENKGATFEALIRQITFSTKSPDEDEEESLIPSTDRQRTSPLAATIDDYGTSASPYGSTVPATPCADRTTPASSFGSTASHADRTTPASSFGSTASHAEPTTPASSFGSTASHAEPTTPTSSFGSTASHAECTAPASSFGSTASHADRTAPTSSFGSTASHADRTTPTSSFSGTTPHGDYTTSTSSFTGSHTSYAHYSSGQRNTTDDDASTKPRKVNLFDIDI